MRAKKKKFKISCICAHFLVRLHEFCALFLTENPGYLWAFWVSYPKKRKEKEVWVFRIKEVWVISNPAPLHPSRVPVSGNMVGGRVASAPKTARKRSDDRHSFRGWCEREPQQQPHPSRHHADTAALLRAPAMLYR